MKIPVLFRRHKWASYPPEQVALYRFSELAHGVAKLKNKTAREYRYYVRYIELKE
jgi:hypothetical protein